MEWDIWWHLFGRWSEFAFNRKNSLGFKLTVWIFFFKHIRVFFFYSFIFFSFKKIVPCPRISFIPFYHQSWTQIPLSILFLFPYYNSTFFSNQISNQRRHCNSISKDQISSCISKIQIEKDQILKLPLDGLRGINEFKIDGRREWRRCWGNFFKQKNMTHLENKNKNWYG